MSDFELPDLPSDEELGITDEDREKYEDDLPADGPELSAEEMAALLGEAAPPGGKASRSKESPKKAKKRKKRTWKWWGGEAAGSAGAGSAEPKAPSGGEAKSARDPEARASRDRGGANPDPEADATTEASTRSGEERETPARESEASGPRSRWRGPLTLAALVAMALAASSRTGQPRPSPANAPDTTFSSARAMSVLVDIARRPRPIGSPEHARVRALLVDRLEELGLDTQVHTATTLTQIPGMARSATVRNVVARLAGTASTGAVLIAAHYDSRELAPGAADDGAGIVTILEAVRALQAGSPLRNDLIVLITDGEEPCLCGAKAFVDQHPWIDDVAVVLNFEMRGAGGTSIMFETNDQNGWIVRALEQADPPPYANSLAYEVYRRMPNSTDFTEFMEAGKQGLNFAALARADVYHQAADRTENLSEATLQHHGVGALATLRYLGEADLSSVDAPNATYVTVPLLGLVVYEAFWIVPISGVLLALALLTWLLVRVRGARISRIFVGVGVAVLGGALSFGIGLWMRSWVTGFYAEAGSLSGSVLHSEGWWVLAAASATLFVVTTLHAIARRWLRVAELTLGALVLPLALAVVASLYVPLGALNVQWPLAAALSAVIVVALLGKRGAGTVGTVATVALAAPVLVILVPVVELVWLAMTAQLIAVVAVLIALTLHLCLPALDSLRHPNSWWAPVTFLGVAAASFGMALLAARPSADRPAPSALAYAYEHGSGAALWVTDARADPVLDAAAIDWAAGAAGATFSRTRDMTDFGLPAGPTPVADARLVNAPPPSVVVQSDSIEGSVRNVSLTVRSNIGAEILRFQPDPAGGTRLLAINGAAIEQPAELHWAEHYGVPEGEGVRLELRMAANQPIALYVVEQLLRPQELLGPAPFQRPAELMPDVNAMSDRAAFRYSVAAYADPRHAFMPGSTVRPTSIGAPAPETPQPVPPPAADSTEVELDAGAAAPASEVDSAAVPATPTAPDSVR